jgi:hypothetical protein
MASQCRGPGEGRIDKENDHIGTGLVSTGSESDPIARRHSKAHTLELALISAGPRILRGRLGTPFPLDVPTSTIWLAFFPPRFRPCSLTIPDLRAARAWELLLCAGFSFARSFKTML